MFFYKWYIMQSKNKDNYYLVFSDLFYPLEPLENSNSGCLKYEIIIFYCTTTSYT